MSSLRALSGWRDAAVAVLCACAAVAAPTALIAKADDGFTVRDPHFGEVLFHFYKDDHFTALTHLVTARSQGRVTRHAFDAELLEGGLLLSWGQHKEAGEIFERLLKVAETQDVRDRTWFYLGKVRYQRGYPAEAEAAFESIRGRLPTELEAERYNLLARIYMDQGRFADAVELLDSWKGEEEWKAYANYNTGVALVRMGELELGASILNKLGSMNAVSDEMRGLRDRANVALGFAYLQSELDGDALPVLQRVRLNGPFSNKALLGAGWAASARNEFRDALAAWLELSDRDLLDSAVQESLLAVPYAFAKLGSEAKAAERYSHALAVYTAEIERLDSAIEAAGAGELVQQLLAKDDSEMGGWHWELEALPGDERTRYLYFTVANHQFHEGLKSYRDLNALEKHLQEWEARLVAYKNILDTRRYAFAERLPRMEARIAEYDLDRMQTVFAGLEAETQRATRERDAVALAPDAERLLWQRLVDLESNPAWHTPAAAELREKHRVLKGHLLWTMDSEFKFRAWRQGKLNASLRVDLQAAHDSFSSIKQATSAVPAELEHFAQRVERLEPLVEGLAQRVRLAKLAHSKFLGNIAIAELSDQKERLLVYRAQARFALANIYDRMSAAAK